MSQARQYDVAVIGLGPVGAAAANLLAQDGLTVFAVDPSLLPYDKPRAIGLDHESLRMLQKIGVAQPLEPFTSSYRTSEYHSQGGEVLRRIIPQPEPHPLAWPPYVTFLQPELERLLRESLGRWPNLQVELGATCTDLTFHDDRPTVKIRRVNGDNERVIACRYVLACDGAASRVREIAGLTLEDLAFDEPWLVVDVQLSGEVQLPLTNVQYCDPRRPCTYVCGPGNLRRWEIMLLPGEDPAEMVQPAKLWALLSRWLRPEQGRIWRAATYRFHALVAKSWHKNGVFLAGDAAHQTPPFMAQGLNQGFRDVTNLCWKIAAVTRGDAEPELLLTYEAERKPNARNVIELTKKLGLIICERDQVAAAERDRVMVNEMQTGAGELVRQDLLPPLITGFLLSDEQGKLTPAAGTMCPQPWLKTEDGAARMDDALAGGYILVTRSTWSPEQDVVSLALELGVTLVCLAPASTNAQVIAIAESNSVLSSWFEKYQIDAALVRPDHIVFGSATGDGAAGALLRSLKRHLGQRSAGHNLDDVKAHYGLGH